MKAMNIKNIIYPMVLLALLISSCSDDFVDVQSQNESSENYFNSEQDYQDALIGAYDLLQSTYLNVLLGEIASENTLAGGGNANDVLGIQQVDDMIHTPTNDQLRDIWGWMFAGVNRANFILEFQDKIDFPNKINVIAQARFLRAYYYFELVKWFGDVPLAVDKRILFGEQFDIDRTSKNLVYAQIEEDLIFAMNNLPVSQIDTGRATKGAAQALLGKAYLFQNKFPEAANVLEDLIETGPYDLVVDYDTIFENDNENNIESVFEVQYTDLEGAGFGCLQCSEGNVAVGFNGVRNYDGPLFDSGFSFNVPTQDMYNAFQSDDLRRDVAILNIDEWAANTGATFSTGNEHTGFFNRKYLPRQGDSGIGDANLTNPNNYRAIRFADVLLMAAEAFNRGNISDDQARTYLNRVRRRAFGNLLNDVSASGPALTTAIYNERKLELVGEGHQFFDLVRTNRAASQIPGFTPNKNEVFPIPSTEIALTGNRWTQNQGY
ncbi:RagB/SusD family nutrient uptake outer membrane protein [Aurantibacter aestuarii]|uniref:RagB/SusD family nutrient uptake outer membrane protein n=1 Tax=Aurantibacter aestuarii TaxID=1266046 RepID=A0A2T1NC23_9FLAO|nr:RagB/SusD family nutrient uptake outer membrane protein [Aurantibacter aestuarii]PSG89964.1 RagB/SusD family nutrient uptake outer membrane protein [Aurantibacter aestuarii]